MTPDQIFSPHISQLKQQQLKAINPALKLRESLFAVLLLLLISAGLEDFAESRVEVGQEGDQNQARDNILRVQVQNAVNVDDI